MGLTTKQEIAELKTQVDALKKDSDRCKSGHHPATNFTFGNGRTGVVNFAFLVDGPHMPDDVGASADDMAGHYQMMLRAFAGGNGFSFVDRNVNDGTPIILSELNEGATAHHLTGLGLVSFATKTADYTLTASDGVILCDASGGPFTITLPPAVGLLGVRWYIKKIDPSGNAITLDGTLAETIDEDGTKIIPGQFNSLTIGCDGVEFWIL